jgi:hypothetical protein
MAGMKVRLPKLASSFQRTSLQFRIRRRKRILQGCTRILSMNSIGSEADHSLERQFSYEQSLAWEATWSNGIQPSAEIKPALNSGFCLQQHQDTAWMRDSIPDSNAITEAAKTSPFSSFPSAALHSSQPGFPSHTQTIQMRLDTAIQLGQIFQRIVWLAGRIRPEQP